MRRLSLYLRGLKILRAAGVKTASSEQIVRPSGISPEQFRKDLSYFGKFGKKGVGYGTGALFERIREIIGTARPCNVILVGVGKLGAALLKYPGFAESNFKICAAFDASRERVGKTFGGVSVRHIKDLKKLAPSLEAKVAILAVNKEAARESAKFITDCGVKAILNFAPASLNLPEKVVVSNMDMACELEALLCSVNNRR